MINWMEDDAKWYRRENEANRASRGDTRKCSCWILHTEACDKEMKNEQHTKATMEEHLP